MKLTSRWEILLVILWIQVGFVPGIHCKDGSVNHVSVEDILLLKDEPNPKCFTRTLDDFTCFFETADNGTYDFFYTVNSFSLPGKNRCEMSVQRTEEGTFLHICSFPDGHVYMHTETNLEVVERNTSTSLYKRVVSVEDNALLYPPFNVSLHQNDKVGQLQVSWHTKASKYIEGNLMYRIHYASSGLEEKTKEISTQENIILDSLVPGEEVEVQVTVKYAMNPDAGHWSSWSHPVRAVVSQSADDISLMCYTSDMQIITCQWNGSRYGAENEYKLFFKMGLSGALGWTEWTECPADRNSTNQCRFHGDESRKVMVRLSSTQVLLSRTFYTQEFTLNKCIKTSPPSHLRFEAMKNKKLCLKWEAPLPSLSAHLEYEVRYQITGEVEWMTASKKGPNTTTCLDVPMGGQYSVKSRAKPFGPIYSGYWSEWSDALTCSIPTDIGLLLLLFFPVLTLITAIFFISLFRSYLSKLKQYVWPPVPNPDKVLQGFLTDIKRQQGNLLLPVKQCTEETTSSVVEIMFETEVSGSRKPSEESSQLLSPERSFSSAEQIDGSPEFEDFPDYVTLNKDRIIHCQKGNKYVDEEFGEKEDLAVKDELFQTCHSSCTDCSVCTPPSLDTDFLNHSYLPLDELADKFNRKVPAARGPGNLYTNFPCS